MSNPRLSAANGPETAAPERVPVFPVGIQVRPQQAQAQAAPADREELDLLALVQLLRRNLWLILLVAALTTAVAAWLAFTRAHVYQSQATVRLANQRSNLTGGLDAMGPAERVIGPQRDPLLSQIEVLRSRTVMGRVVDLHGLRLVSPGAPGVEDALRDVQVPVGARPDTFELTFGDRTVEVRGAGSPVRGAYGAPLALPGGVRFTVGENPGVPSGQLVVVPRTYAVLSLMDALEARPREKTDLFDLYLVANAPHKAQRVLDGIVAEFQRLSAEQAQQLSRRRRIFLEQQLRESDAVLADVQLALASFRREQQVFSSADRIASEEAGLVNVDVRREELEAERQTSRALLAAAERDGANPASLRALVSSPAIASNPVILGQYEQWVRYQASRDSLTTGPWRSADSNPDVQRVNALIASTQQAISDAARSHIASLDARIGALDALRSRRENRMQGLPSVAAEEVRLSQQVASTQAVADQLRTELQKARIAEAVEVGEVEVVDPALYPAAPLGGERVLRTLLGLLVGLGLGCAGAVLREKANTTIRTREDLEQLVPASPLAVIPRASQAGGLRDRLNARGNGRPAAAAAGGLDAALVTTSHFHSAGAEAYRTLRTNLLFSQASHRLKTLMVTSSAPAEGKTTTSSNLAATFAQQGMRVLLVDCDLRRPRVHELFGTTREPGLTHLVLSYASIADAVRPTAVENLSVLPAGALPPNPSELLGSEAMRAVLEELRNRFDLVILDTSPVLLAPDASILGAGADGVLLVARAGVTERSAVRQTVQQLATVGAHLLGTVLNDADARAAGYAYYAHGYYGGSGAE
jgi:capsular exopolysaccharide synthesis family protein